MAETENNEPAQRDDNIGRLARRLVGDEDNLPDFTTAPLLFDALMEEGDRDTAFRLRFEMANLGALLNTGDMEPRDRAQALRSIQNNLVSCLTPVLFDFNSLAMQLDKLVARCSAKAEVKQGELKLQTVRIPVGVRARRGDRVQIDDERAGMMVSERYEDGTADVMPLEEEYGYAEDGGVPMTNPWPPPRAMGVRKARP